MSKGAADRWARKRWLCRVCGVEGAQGHKTRHLKSLTHIRNEQLLEAHGERYDLMDSDIEFGKFLARTTPAVLTGYEQAILLTMLNPELEDIFKENQDGRLEREGVTAERRAYRSIRSDPTRSPAHLQLVGGSQNRYKEHRPALGDRQGLRRVQGHR